MSLGFFSTEDESKKYVVHQYNYMYWWLWLEKVTLLNNNNIIPQSGGG